MDEDCGEKRGSSLSNILQALGVLTSVIVSILLLLAYPHLATDIEANKEREAGEIATLNATITGLAMRLDQTDQEAAQNVRDLAARMLEVERREDPAQLRMELDDLRKITQELQNQIRGR